ncbi:hypothetical protein ACIOEW_17870 [Streptomyces sp. NPDC087901]
MFLPVHGLRGDGGPMVGLDVWWRAPHNEVREYAPTEFPGSISDGS